MSEPLDMTAVRIAIARAFLHRAATLKMKRGVARDKAALEFVCGAQAAITACGGDDTMLEGVIFQTALRGFATLETLATSRGDK